LGKRTRDFAFVSLCYGRSGEEICTGYAMAASGRMQYDYKQTNKREFREKIGLFALGFGHPTSVMSGRAILRPPCCPCCFQEFWGGRVERE